MLIAFMVYIGVVYDRLIGDECNCFPWIKRVAGSVFFVGDAVMLCLAGVARWLVRQIEGIACIRADRISRL